MSSIFLLIHIFLDPMASAASEYFSVQDAEVLGQGEKEVQLKSARPESQIDDGLGGIEVQYSAGLISDAVQWTAHTQVVRERLTPSHRFEYAIGAELRGAVIRSERILLAAAVSQEFEKIASKLGVAFTRLELPITINLSRSHHSIGARDEIYWEGADHVGSVILGGRVHFSKRWGWVYETIYRLRNSVGISEGLAYRGGLFIEFPKSQIRIQSMLFSREPGGRFSYGVLGLGIKLAGL